MSPFDTATSASSRFAIELVAWVVGPWAAAARTGQWWVAIPVAIVLIAVPAIFSTRGDKKQVVVATPGTLRVVIELALLVVAIVGAWDVLPTWAFASVIVIGAVMLASGRKRLQWLASGAGHSTM